MPAKNLVALLSSGIRDLESEEALTILEGEGGLCAWDRRYEFGSHIWGRQNSSDLEALRKSETQRLALLSSKLLRDLGEGDKIFVYKSRDDTEDVEMEPVYAALRLYGNHCLLWVNRCADKQRVARLERVRANLFRGYVSPPLGKLQETTNLVDWVEICRSAWSLRQVAQSEGRANG